MAEAPIYLPDQILKDAAKHGELVVFAGAGEVEEAEWICNAFAEQGSTLLKQNYGELRGRHRAPSGTDQSAE